MPITLTKSQAKQLWLHAQGLDVRAPFGGGAQATPKAVEHLGYVQIDTINVIERSHHHILYSRIPDYKRAHLQAAQSKDKSVFEYWTHALAYVPTKDFRYFLPRMKFRKKDPGPYYSNVKKEDMQKVLRLLRKGPLSIRDIDDDVLIEKDHEWASRKPSKKALQAGFNAGDFVISERVGMLKKYDLAKRHFAWKTKPKAATPKEVLEYKIDRALRAQALVSLESICHLEPSQKPAVRKVLESRVGKRELVEVKIEGDDKTLYWIAPELLEDIQKPNVELVHILSPFDPLTIQRKRLNAFFGYDHRFEAYIPKEKRVYGYFGLPVLVGENLVAVLDLKTDREKQKLLMQKWSWLPGGKSSERKRLIEDELSRFERFQLDK